MARRCRLRSNACSWPAVPDRAEPSASVAIEHEISPQPARVGPATVTLKLADAAGKPITGAHIAIEADMSHAGMSPGVRGGERNRAWPLPSSPGVSDGG